MPADSFVQRLEFYNKFDDKVDKSDSVVTLSINYSEDVFLLNRLKIILLLQ